MVQGVPINDCIESEPATNDPYTGELGLDFAVVPT